MEIIQEKKRNIEKQYQSMRAKIISQKILSKFNQPNPISQQSSPNQYFIQQSKRVLQEHSNSTNKNKYLGKIKIYTVDGQKTLPCGCQKYGMGNCQNNTHDSIRDSKKKDENKFNEQLLKFSRSLSTIRSEKFIHRLQNQQKNELKKTKFDYINRPRMNGLTTAQKTNEAYGINFYQSKNLDDRKNMDKFQVKRPKITANECSFCLKKSQNFICNSCWGFKLKR